MLILDGRLDAIRLRIALLELRVGNPAGALAQLTRLDEPNLTEDEARTARLLRAEAEEANTRQRIDGRVQLGLRFDSNANAAPDAFDSDVLQPGIGTLGSDREADFSVVGDLGVAHSYDPKRQDALTLDTTLRLFGKKQFQLDDFDTIYGRLTSGPRFRLESSRPKRMTLRTYGIGEFFVIGGELYSASPGLGVEIRDRPIPRFDWFADAEVVFNFFGSAAEVVVPPTVDAEVTLPARDPDDLKGVEVRAEVGATWTPLPALQLTAIPFIGYRDADDPSFRRLEFGIRAAGSLALDVIGPASDRPVRLLADVGVRRFDYEASGLGGIDDRDDTAFDVSGGVEVPIGERFALISTIRWQRTTSTVDSFEWDNLQATVAGAWRF